MRNVFILTFTLIWPGLAVADDPAKVPANLRGAIDRGLAFLVTDALAWKKEHNCVSCHHASQIIWSLREAKQRGFTVDEPVLAELTKWVAENGDGKTGVPRPATAPNALNTKALYFALALSADSNPDPVSQAGLKRFVATIQSDQIENGSWVAWPDTRPPYFGGSSESMTALATLAVLTSADGGDDASRTVRDKGLRWLAETKTDDDPQSIALRLILWPRLGRPKEEVTPLVHRIRERQNEDGGWSQATGMGSDAWATGQALYALSNAGVDSADPSLQRAQNFLLKTQREDGSWPMTSRPTTPGGAGSNSLIPITGGGSAWAVLGLVRSYRT